MKDNKIIWSSSSNSKCPEQFLWLLLVIFMIESGAVIATPDLGSNQLFLEGYSQLYNVIPSPDQFISGTQSSQ